MQNTSQNNFACIINGLYNTMKLDIGSYMHLSVALGHIHIADSGRLIILFRGVHPSEPTNHFPLFIINKILENFQHGFFPSKILFMPQNF